MLVFSIFILGLFLGSFFNVVADRLFREEKFLTGRSYCEHCHKTLAWFDLLPVVSFLSTRGACRYCHTRLSFFYPLSEIGTGGIFALTYFFLNINQSIVTYLFYAILLSSLIIIFLMDYKYGYIPFVILLPMSIITLFYILYISPTQIYIHMLSMLGSFIFLFLLFAGTKGRGMGFGDVVFAGFMGLLLGYPSIILAHYIAFLTGALISSILILLKRKNLKGSTIPFGPFLVLGTYICLLWGEKIIEIITKLIL